MRNNETEPDPHDPKRNSVTTGRREEARTGRNGHLISRSGSSRTAMRSKAIISTFAVLILLTASLSIMTDENGNGDDLNDTLGSAVRVTDITNVPTSALVGMPLTLTGTVLPVNASYNTITWSIKDAGATGASLSVNILTAQNTGTLTVTASVIWEEFEFIMVSAGLGHTVAVNDKGELWAWGSNGSGQLGLGDNENRNTPFRVGTASDWKSVSVGNEHTAAVKNDGTIWSWGYNQQGQLGVGDNANRNTPTQVGNATDWRSVSAGGNSTMAINDKGELWAFGYNQQGQLGVGDNANRNTPAQAGNATDWRSVSAGGVHTTAINDKGELWAWGNNADGHLGLGDTTDRSSPVQVGNATDWASVSAGGGSTMSVNNKGELWVWGSNWNDQLGLGDSGTNGNTPTLQTPTTFTKDFTITAMDRNHQYWITGSGNTFTAIGYMSDNVSTYTVSGASNVSIQNVINAIRADADGDACVIELNNLNIEANNIEFSNTVDTWNTVTVKGSLTSSHNTDGSGVIVVSDNVNMNIQANITGTGSSEYVSVIRNNGTGTVSVSGGTINAGGTANAITNVNANGSITLGGNPTITGNIHVAPGTLSVLTSGANTFEPSHANTYAVSLSGTLSAGLTAVTNGAAFADRFTSADQTWMFEPENNDLVLTYDPEYWFIVTFDPNNGEDTWNEFVLMSAPSTLTKPGITWKKDGYVSEGKWYIDDTAEFIFGTTSVNGNITLHLKWTAAAVTISTTTVANGLISMPYYSPITASLEGGAAGAISFSVHAGALPPGLTLNASTGVISGISENAGEYTFTVRAVSVITGESDERTFTVSIFGGGYYWKNDPDNKFMSLAGALVYNGTGELTASGSFVDDLGATGPIVFDRSVILCFEEGAELTLKDGHVTIGGVDLTGGKLILDNTTLIILGDLTGSGDVELVNDSKLIVIGNIDIDGSITGSGDISADGNANIGGNIDIDGNVNVGENLNVGGDANIGGNLTVGGDADIGGDLNVGGDADIGGDLTVGGDANIGGNLTVGGDADTGGDLNVGGDANIGGDLTVGGDANIDGDLTVGGDVDIGGDLNVGGDVNVGGDLTTGTGDKGGPGDVNVGGDLTVGGDVYIGGDLTVGGDVNVIGDLEVGGDLTLVISNETISIAGVEKTYRYTGSEIRPEFTVTCNGKLLTEGADYVVTYSNNINVGKAKVTIEFIGEYEHIPTLTKSFRIVGDTDARFSDTLLVILLGILLVISGIILIRRNADHWREK